MKFKVDENLPIEIAELLQAERHNAVTVVDQKMTGAHDPEVAAVCRKENRILVTLDLDFADIQTYPPKESPGIIVFRVRRQDRRYLIEVFRHAISLIARETLERRLWIIEETRVRIHGE